MTRLYGYDARLLVMHVVALELMQSEGYGCIYVLVCCRHNVNIYLH